MKILKFGASWCAPCRSLNNIMGPMILPYRLSSIDIDESPRLAGHYGIRSVPTLVLVNELGEEQSRLVGAKTKSDILEWLP